MVMTSLREAAATFNNIGRLLHDRGRYNEAFQNYRDAISIRASMLRGLRFGADGAERRRQQEQSDSGYGPPPPPPPQQQPASLAVPSPGITSTSPAPPVVEHEIAQRMKDATELYRRLLIEEQQLQHRAPETTGTSTSNNHQDTSMYDAETIADGTSSTPSGLSSNHPSRDYGAALDCLCISQHGGERRGITDEDHHAASSRHSLLCPSRPIALYVNEEFARREEEVGGNGDSARRDTVRPAASPSPSSSSWSTASSGNQETTGPSTSRRSSHLYDISPDDDDYDEYLDSGVTLFNMGLVFSQHPASENLESAQRLMAMALSVIPPNSSSIYAMVLTCDAYVHYRVGRLEQAMSSLVQALSILSSGIDRAGPEGDSGTSSSRSRRPSVPTKEVSVAIFSLLLRMHYEKGDGSAALENGNVLMYFVTSAYGADSVQAAIVHYNLSLVMFAAGKIEQTFEHGNKFLDLIFQAGQRHERPFAMISPRDSIGVDPVLSEEVHCIFTNQFLRKQLAAAIHTLGRLHVEALSVQRGLLLLEQALFLRVKWLTQDDQDVEESHICVGRIKSDLGIYPSAIFHFKLALGAIEAFVAKHHGGECNTSIAADICGLKTLIAQSYYSHGDLEEALRAYDEVLEILHESSVGNRAEALSNILSMRGNIQMEMGEVSQAMVSHTHGRYLPQGYAVIPSLICSSCALFPVQESFVEAARELVSASSFDPSGELPLVLPSLFQAYGVQFHTAAAAA